MSEPRRITGEMDTEDEGPITGEMDTEDGPVTGEMHIHDEPRVRDEVHVLLVAPGHEGALDAHRADVEAIAHAAFPTTSFAIADELARPWTRIWIALPAQPGRAVGYLVGWHVADELHVLHVASDPLVRRRGIGSALVRQAIAYAAAHAVRIVILEVARSNVAAIRLYRRHRFAVLDVRKGYYEDTGEDAIEMMLVLDPQSGRVVPTEDEIRIDG